MSEDKKLTTASGIPYYYNEDTMSVGPRGPLLLQDFILHEKMAHFNRERIPERVVHAKVRAHLEPSLLPTTSSNTHVQSFSTRLENKQKCLQGSQLLAEKKEVPTQKEIPAALQ
jgi:catalase